ncbi:1-aminocyclopropane-1-carboxylate deaminase/D-cysteine desulfhydrase [Thalassolituus sp. LLYu03]|uniref:1-aminocyclopropane-1-carboxylate deaminase/D-cysteine desulfhydrase n=1 Tax=Thalassolituus sp. LLYu03 TaxID=3421656 RepID=UPI003D2B157A
MSDLPIPLLRAYPALIPHVPLANLPGHQCPTPVTVSLDHAQLWLKHDDLTNRHYGGNKSRKLAFILGRLQAQGQTQLVTFGGTGTNHGLACAVHCQALGIGCEVLLFDQPPSASVTANFRAMQQAGARLTPCGSLLRTVLTYYGRALLSRLQPASRTAYLFAGGSSVEGVLAFIDAAFELREQVAAGLCPEPECIVCPVGSGATLAGLTLGVALAGLRSRVIGVRVAPSHLGPFAACTTGTVAALMSATVKRLRAYGVTSPVLQNLPAPVLLDHYYGEGYGVASAAGQDAASWFLQQRWADERFVTVEGTYTAKALAALRDQLAQTSGPVLYWHTLNSSAEAFA